MTSNHKPTRSEQRDAARQKAKALREQNQKKAKRSKLILQVSVVLVALGIVGGVAAVIAIENANQVAAPVVPAAQRRAPVVAPRASAAAVATGSSRPSSTPDRLLDLSKCRIGRPPSRPIFFVRPAPCSDSLLVGPPLGGREGKSS